MRATRLALITAAALVSSCAADNVHQPEPDPTPAPQRFEGHVTSSIPIIPSFNPVTDPNCVIIKWGDAQKATATVQTAGFAVDVAEVSMHIEIGPMTITDVICHTEADGSITLTNDAFSCMAGSYLAKGRLSGVLAGDDVKIDIYYRPGSMPFEVRSTFDATFSPSNQ